MKARVYKYMTLGDCNCFLGGFGPMNWKPSCYQCSEAYKYTVRKVENGKEIKYYLGRQIKNY